MKTPNGLEIAQLADGSEVTIATVNLNLQVLEKLNESEYSCKVIGVVEVSPDDP